MLKEVSTLCMGHVGSDILRAQARFVGTSVFFLLLIRLLIVRSINEILKKTEKTLKKYPHYVTITCQQQFARQAFFF